MKLRIAKGRLVDPANARDEIADLFIDGAHIVGLGRAPAGFRPDRVIDAAGFVVCPGFVEIGASLREPGAEHKATIASELTAAASAGFTTVCCAPDTDPVVDTPAVVELIYQRAKGIRGARVRCIGALTRGLQGEVLAEMHALKDIGCVGVTNATFPIHDSKVMRNALAYAATLELTVFVHSADPWLARGFMHEGAISTRLGIPAVPTAAELIGLGRDLVLVEDAGVRAHFCRLSTAGGVKLLNDARKAGLRVSADVSLTHLMLCDADVDGYDANCHVQPPLRAARDRARLRRAIGNAAVDAVCAQHQPHDADAKSAPFSATEPGVSGFDVFLPLLLELVDQRVLDLPRAIAAAAVEPARIAGIESGTFDVGAIADICVFDAAEEWVVSPTEMRSQGKNSPFVGRTVHGRTVMTLVGGRIVFEGRTT